MVMRQNDRPGAIVVLSDDQFKRLEELLLPGYTLAKQYLEQNRPEEPPAHEDPPADKPDTSGDQST